MGRVGWGFEVEKKFIRLEEELVLDCISFMDLVVLQESVSNKWTWKHNQGDNYFVKVAYKQLSDVSSLEVHPLYDIIWNKLISLKVSLFVRKLVNNRLPTKVVW